MRPVHMSTCPLCGQEIRSDQATAWRRVADAPARVHAACLAPPTVYRGRP